MRYVESDWLGTTTPTRMSEPVIAPIFCWCVPGTSGILPRNPAMPSKVVIGSMTNVISGSVSSTARTGQPADSERRGQRLVGARAGRRQERHGLERGLGLLGIGGVERARVSGARAIRKLGVGDDDLGPRLRSEGHARAALLAVPDGRPVE